MKLGKRPATHDERDLLFERYADAELLLATLPAVWGNGFAFSELGPLPPPWGMLANDGIGDCVVAGGDHEEMTWNKVWGGRLVTFSDRNTIKDYSAIGGYVPGDESTDQGLDMRVALNYRRRIGLTDASGAKHLLHSYAALKIGDWHELLMATYLFGAAGIGFNFPAIAWKQFDNRLPWDVTSNDGRNEGGHYVPCVGFGNPRPDVCAVVSWGRRQLMTRAFYEKYADEAYALVSASALNALGVGPHGYSLAKMDADLAVLTA